MGDFWYTYKINNRQMKLTEQNDHKHSQREVILYTFV